MRNYLKNYTVTLTVMGPIFIGSGNELTKKEYIRKGNKIIVPKFEEMYLDIEKEGKTQSFEAYMTGNDRTGLDRWIRNEGIKDSYIDKWTKYTLDCSGIENENNMQIMTFVKDNYGNPYIPGSSIKGMLRTILLADDIVQKPSKYESVKKEIKSNLVPQNRINRNNYLKQQDRHINEMAFNTLKRTDKKSDMVNDKLTGLIVGDSEPVDVNSLTVCQKIERHVDGEKTRLNLSRECLKPGTHVKFALTIDTSLCDITIEQINRAIETFANLYNKFYVSKFKVKPIQNNYVLLGGGVGFPSKTVIGALFGEESVDIIPKIFKATKVPANHKHDRDKSYGVSPHIIKYTSYNNSSYKFGLCTLTFEQNF